MQSAEIRNVEKLSPLVGVRFDTFNALRQIRYEKSLSKSYREICNRDA